jgi:VCBS repeat-containing protein
MRNKLRSDAPLAIEVPTPTQDKPAWVKVGVIAAVGFVIGIAWPRLAGVRIGPSAPGESAAAASASHGGRAPDGPPPASVTKVAGAPSSSAAAPAAAPATTTTAAAAPPKITVSKGLVLSCKTTDGETKKGKDCGAVPGVDEIVRPRVRNIATCSGMEGQTGKFSLTANADFVSGRFWYEVNTKSATVQNLDAVQSCLKTVFHNTATVATPHEHNKYTVVYTAQLAAGEDKDKDKVAEKSEKADSKAKAPAEEKAPETQPEKPEKAEKTATATGEAEIAWDVGLVRDTPKTGALVARLPRGTKVKVGTSKDGWYQVKYGDGFASEGWLYRGAIGR